MNNSKEMLSSILKSVRTEQRILRRMLERSMNPALRRTLESRLREYDAIESEVHFIASQRGWDLREPDPAILFLSDRMTRMKLTLGNSDSGIADLVIRGHTNSMINGLKNLHRYPKQDDRISAVCQKLLDCETAGIRQMQFFL